VATFSRRIYAIWPADDSSKYWDSGYMFSFLLLLNSRLIYCSGQLRLHNARVLIIGAGGLGCPAAAYIAGTGVKTLGIVDGDTVELSNLHRQILHNESTIGMFKVDSAIRNLKKYTPYSYYKGPLILPD
jgi:molybdopterin/thiamine biosynthesis adenylyltransferase